MEKVNRTLRTVAFLCLLAALTVLAYGPVFGQPLIEDDYPNIAQAQLYGPVAGWPAMMHDPVFRVRATTWLLMYGIHCVFGMWAPAYYAALVALQILNTWLVFALGSWRDIGYRTAAWAAAFFAVYEGHQEAVMWLSGSTEPLMLFFGLLSLLFWIQVIQNAGAMRIAFYVASLACFSLALLSKESAVIWAALLLLPIVFDRPSWRQAFLLVPYAVLSAVVALSILESRSQSFRFQDGSFSMSAPFWLTWPHNMLRLFWPWGLAALIAIFLWRPAAYRKLLTLGLCWAGLGLIPYSFLTYSRYIPSRQLHLASVGLALVAGYAFMELFHRYWQRRRAIVVAVCGLLLIHNVGYLWVKKRSQFLARAAPTEALIAFARTHPGLIYVQCFPRQQIIAESAIQLTTTSRVVWAPTEGAHTFCYPAESHR